LNRDTPRHQGTTWHDRDLWPGLLERAGFRLDSIEDLTEAAAREFEDLLAALRTKRSVS
jgi:hypothetical protein